VQVAPPTKLGVQAAQFVMTDWQVVQEVAVLGKYPVIQTVQFMLYPPTCWQLTQLGTMVEHKTQDDPLAV
jgi:hypothetical protein